MAQFVELEELTEESEEYQMLREVSESLERLITVSTLDSGRATRLVIHKHLTDRGVRLPNNPEIQIREIRTRMTLLYLLKPEVASNKREYSVHDLKAVLKIVNNAVGENYQTKVTNKFKKFQNENHDLKFATIVLSENTRPATNPYEHRFTQTKFGDLAKLFTLIIRRRPVRELYRERTIAQLLSNGDLRKPQENGLEDLIKWLKSV